MSWSTCRSLALRRPIVGTRLRSVAESASARALTPCRHRTGFVVVVGLLAAVVASRTAHAQPTGFPRALAVAQPSAPVAAQPQGLTRRPSSALGIWRLSELGTAHHTEEPVPDIGNLRTVCLPGSTWWLPTCVQLARTDAPLMYLVPGTKESCEVATPAEQANVVLMREGCHGTLLQGGRLLTAAHCVKQLPAADQSKCTVADGFGPATCEIGSCPPKFDVAVCDLSLIAVGPAAGGGESYSTEPTPSPELTAVAFSGCGLDKGPLCKFKIPAAGFSWLWPDDLSSNAYRRHFLLSKHTPGGATPPICDGDSGMPWFEVDAQGRRVKALHLGPHSGQVKAAPLFNVKALLDPSP